MSLVGCRYCAKEIDNAEGEYVHLLHVSDMTPISMWFCGDSCFFSYVLDKVKFGINGLIKREGKLQ